MIAVIADDLTGAAEIAGLGWRHGLTTVILHRDEKPVTADLVVYDSDSRNCSADESRRRVTRIVKRLQTKAPTWIFKKTDSVLRGNVVAEVEAALTALKLSRCILISANPTAGRFIRDGKYFIHSQAIHKTDFRQDPLHPRTSPFVRDLLGGSKKFPLAVLKNISAVPAAGIVTGQATTTADVRRWAAHIDTQTFAAGGAEFFLALLRQRGLKPKPSSTKAKVGRRTLFICGSQSAATKHFLAQSSQRGWPVLPMPKTIFSPHHAAHSFWSESICEALKIKRTVVMAIGLPPQRGAKLAEKLGEALTAAGVVVLKMAKPTCVCVEGGATAALLLQQLGWTQLVIECEFATGVVGVRPKLRGAPLLVLKPGSYVWPKALLD